MSPGWIIFAELTLVLGLALFFGFRELHNLRRYDRERAEAAKKQSTQPRHAEGEHGLDDR
jgi:hypothetical protein